MPSAQFSVRPKDVTRILSRIVLFLLLASLACQIFRFSLDLGDDHRLVRLFDVGEERNFPTFFTVLVALGCAQLLVLIGVVTRQRADADYRYWFALAAGFVFLAFDEGFQMHEILLNPMRAMMGEGERGLFHFAWVIPGIAGVCILGLLFSSFLLRLPAAIRHRLMLSGALYLGGALGMEMLNGAYTEAYGNNFTYALLVMIEEGLEMAGLVMLAHVLLAYLAGISAKVELNLDTAAQLQTVPVPQAKLG